MFRVPKRRRSAPRRSPEAVERIQLVADRVDRAEEALLAAVPRGRGPGAPIAEALAAFEEHLRAALGSLEGWPEAQEVERRVLAEAIDRSLGRAEALRLKASPQGYEELYALLGETLDPLDAVAEVAERLRRDSR